VFLKKVTQNKKAKNPPTDSHGNAAIKKFSMFKLL